MSITRLLHRSINKQVCWFLVVIGIYLPIHVINLQLNWRAPRKLENEDQESLQNMFNSMHKMKMFKQKNAGVWNINADEESLRMQDVIKPNVRNYNTISTYRQDIQAILAEAPPSPFNISFIHENADFCEHWSPRYLIYIHTSPGNLARRQVLRETWGNRELFRDRRTAIVFMMGETPDMDKRQAVESERKLYGDIVIAGYTDSYHNLSIKGVIALKWLIKNCPNVEFALKSDDDAFVNIFRVLDIISREQREKRASHLVVCPVWPNNSMPILRDPKKCSKWCIKETEFPGRKRYPRYCAGISFAISPDAAVFAYKAALSVPFFWVDDVYITGLLFSAIPHVRYIDTGRNFRADAKFTLRHYSNLTQPLRIYYSHVRKSEMANWLWELALLRLDWDELSEVEPRVYATMPRVRDKVRQVTNH